MGSVKSNMKSFIVFVLFVAVQGRQIDYDYGYWPENHDAEFVRADVIPRVVVDRPRLVKDVYVDKVQPLYRGPVQVYEEPRFEVAHGEDVGRLGDYGSYGHEDSGRLYNSVGYDRLDGHSAGYYQLDGYSVQDYGRQESHSDFGRYVVRDYDRFDGHSVRGSHYDRVYLYEDSYNHRVLDGRRLGGHSRRVVEHTPTHRIGGY